MYCTFNSSILWLTAIAIYWGLYFTGTTISSMRSGTLLSPSERFAIAKLHGKYYTQKKIAELLHRPLSVILYYLKHCEDYGTRKSSGWLPKMSDRMKRQIWQLASKGTMSARDIKAAKKASITVCQVQRIILATPYLRYCKQKHMPMLLAHHKTK